MPASAPARASSHSARSGRNLRGGDTFAGHGDSSRAVRPPRARGRAGRGLRGDAAAGLRPAHRARQPAGRRREPDGAVDREPRRQLRRHLVRAGRTGQRRVPLWRARPVLRRRRTDAPARSGAAGHRVRRLPGARRRRALHRLGRRGLPDRDGARRPPGHERRRHHRGAPGRPYRGRRGHRAGRRPRHALGRRRRHRGIHLFDAAGAGPSPSSRAQAPARSAAR